MRGERRGNGRREEERGSKVKTGGEGERRGSKRAKRAKRVKKKKK